LPETQDVKPKLGTPPNKSPPPQVEVEEIVEDEELYGDVVNGKLADCVFVCSYCIVNS
jgi:hypothetical protein